MRRKIIRISFELLKSWFTDGPHVFAYSVSKNPLPADAELIAVLPVDHRFCFSGVDLVIRRESFPEVDEGSMLLIEPVEITRLDPASIMSTVPNFNSFLASN